MPVHPRIRNYIEQQLAPPLSAADFQTQLEVVIINIFHQFQTDPSGATHAAGYLCYFLSLNYMRSDNDRLQLDYSDAVTSLFRRLYHEADIIQAVASGAPQQGRSLLVLLYHVHHAFIMNGLRAPSGPERLDHADALRMLQIIVGAAYGPWHAHIRLHGAIRDYHHVRILERPNGLQIEVGRLPGVAGRPLRVATWNMQGSSEATDTKWRNQVLALARSNDVVALQEAGVRPASAHHVEDITLMDQFGYPHTVQHYLWEAGTTSRSEQYQVFFFNVGRFRVNLAILVADYRDINIIGPVVISDGLPDAQGAPTYRPALGLEIRRSSVSGVSTETVTVFNFHAISGGGVNAPRMLREISWYTPTRFAVVGDFNRDPREPDPAFPARRGNWVSPPDIAQLVQSTSATHPSTAPQNMLDYAVTNGTTAMTPTGTVNEPGPSDHRAASFEFSFP
ncbi:endonuclease/exonuclease/phosphatase family protein [Pseudomonas abietaniphila]|uniref:Endonuclease/Exonuclease/phosphatase family protein n=1 Tax=Pseudomonas abietaniphila TaxID=89065 RepID=A0A1G8DKB5_9PSED|nr:endonuclease/exonuclease/phosphatase family protein [Pseudomonas abietaniphila]SDH58107.1 Endonuclease/Exonuclease/phosphatase family protein [Pseudomonas abietaniphila]